MKIQKSLLAVIAMAGTMGFSAVASAMDFSVYGSLRGGINQTEAGDVTPLTNAAESNLAVPAANADVTAPAAAIVEGTKEKAADASLVLGHGEFGSRIGVRGSEDLGNGAEAGLHWETGIGADGTTGGGRHANVWYSGAFGKVTIGQQGNPYRNAANWDQSWWLGGQNRAGVQNGVFNGDGGSRLQGVRYDGDAGAFNFSVMAVAQDTTAGFDFDRDPDNGLTRDADGGFSLPVDNEYYHVGAAGQFAIYRTVDVERAEVEDESGVDAWIATGHYDMGVATINLGYRVNNVPTQALGTQYDNFVISANGTLDALDWYIAFEQNTDNADVKVTNTATGAVTAEDTAAAKLIEDSFSLQDTTTIGLFLGYHLSDVSTIYLEWEDTANDGLDLKGDNLDRNSTLLGYSRSIGPNTSFIAEYVTVDNTSEAAADSTTLQGYLKVDF